MSIPPSSRRGNAAMWSILYPFFADCTFFLLRVNEGGSRTTTPYFRPEAASWVSLVNTSPSSNETLSIPLSMALARALATASAEMSIPRTDFAPARPAVREKPPSLQNASRTSAPLLKRYSTPRFSLWSR